MTKPATYSARHRERIWDASCVDCDGNSAPRPDCNICGLPVHAGDDWDISHMPVPATFGGKTSGVAAARVKRMSDAQLVGM